MGWDENLTGKTNEIALSRKIRKQLQAKSHPHLHLPHYLILMDSIEADVTYDQLRYLAQNEIVPANRHHRILNLALGDYFESYHNGKYVMRPWLQNMYPRD